MNREIADTILEALDHARNKVNHFSYHSPILSHADARKIRRDKLEVIARAADCIRELKKAMPKEASP